VWETGVPRQLTTIAAPRPGGVTRLQFVNEDTLVGWIGGWRAHPADEIAVWHAPPFKQIAAAGRLE
jgi:hypothetical protein